MNQRISTNFEQGREDQQMKIISVCIGSSCHLKGSYGIIEALKALLAQKGLEKEVELSASFCLGHCTDGVTIKVDDRLVTGVTKDNIAQILDRELAGVGA